MFFGQPIASNVTMQPLNSVGMRIQQGKYELRTTNGNLKLNQIPELCSGMIENECFEWVALGFGFPFACELFTAEISASTRNNCGTA